MGGTVSTFNHNSAMQRESDGGQINGYQTIHYSIDTARWDAGQPDRCLAASLWPWRPDKARRMGDGRRLSGEAFV